MPRSAEPRPALTIDPGRVPAHLLAPEPEGWELPDFDRIGFLALDWVDHHAGADPTRVAARHEEQVLTYGELRDGTMGCAAAIRNNGIRPGAVVGLVSRNSIESLVVMLGVMRAGCVVVPVDPTDGLTRARQILDDVDADLLLCDAWGHEVAGACGRKVLEFEEMSTGDSDEGPVLQPDLPARILFTSGSTGRPKGFVQSHAMITDWAYEAVVCDRCGPYDRVGNLFSVAFAGSTTTVFGALMVGARLSLFDMRNREMAALPEWFRDEGISWTNATPNMWRGVLALTADPACFSTLRVMRLSGDRVLPSDLDESWRVLVPPARLALMYVSTDTGAVARALLVPGSQQVGERVPLGWPTPGRTVRIVDAQGEQVPVGEVGEIEVQRQGPSPWRFRSRAELGPAPVGSPGTELEFAL